MATSIRSISLPLPLYIDSRYENVSRKWGQKQHFYTTPRYKNVSHPRYENVGNFCLWIESVLDKTLRQYHAFKNHTNNLKGRIDENSKRPAPKTGALAGEHADKAINTLVDLMGDKDTPAAAHIPKKTRSSRGPSSYWNCLMTQPELGKIWQ